MKVIIVGAGIVGIQLAKRLIDENNDVILIDNDPDAVKDTTHTIDCMVVHDKGNNLNVLKKAGIDKTDYFVCVTGSDELNLVTCSMVSQSFSKPVTIARVRNEDYLYPVPDGYEHRYYNVDHIINPGKEASDAVIRTIECGVLRDITMFEGTLYEMTNLTIPEESPFSGRRIEEIRKSMGFDFLIGVVIRNDDFMIPGGDTLLYSGDTIYVISTRKNLLDFISRAGQMKSPPKSIAVVGGGEIGAAVASFLLGKRKGPQSFFTYIRKIIPKNKKKTVTLVEKSYSKCKLLSERFPDALVINADISDEGFFEENMFSDYDLIVTTTEKEELNLITAMYAKTQGIKKAITLVHQSSYVNVAYKLGIDVAVSLKSCVISSILRLVRRGGVKNTYSISDGRLELVEISLQAGAPVVGVSIRRLKLPGGALILFIARGQENFVPGGDYTFQEDDKVFVITRKDVIPKIEKRFGTTP